MRAYDGRLRVWGTLPDRYGDRQIAASTIDAHGRIVALVVDPDVECAQRGGNDAPYDATLVLVDGQDCHETLVQDLDLRFPKLDVLNNGFVLAAGRCRMPSDPPVWEARAMEAEVPHNALVVDADGGLRSTFHAGDAIGHLMTDVAGTIWIGYFDESSILALWPVGPSSQWVGKRPTKRMSIMTPGVIRWASNGDPLWYATTDGSGPQSWMDCYALNIGREYAWAYPYTGFPLVEIDDQGVRSVRRTPVRSASAVMTAGDRSAFLIAPGERPKTPGMYELILARSADGPIEAESSTPLLLPDGRQPQNWARRTICRDNRMWFQFDDPLTWYVIEL